MILHYLYCTVQILALLFVGCGGVYVWGVFIYMLVDAFRNPGTWNR